MTGLIRILSIDGGGVRGIIAAAVLRALEAKLQQRTGNPDARIVDLFDLVAGTSTGAILACAQLTPDPATGRPRYSAKESLQFYLDHGAEIFRIPVNHRIRTAAGLGDEKYPATGLENVLRQLYGDCWLSQLLKPTLIPAYDIRRRKAVFFTQDDARKREGKDFLVRDICRASTAAPAFFETALIRSRSGVAYPLVDGGVFANNPAQCAYAEARTHFGATSDNVLILSLGTGRTHHAYEYAAAKDWGALGWMRPLLDIMMSSGSETVDYQCSLALNHPGSPRRYFRFDSSMEQRPLGVSGQMDDTTKVNLGGLAEMGAELADHRDRDLDHFLDLACEETSDTD